MRRNRWSGPVRPVGGLRWQEPLTGYHVALHGDHEFAIDVCRTAGTVTTTLWWKRAGARPGSGVPLQRWDRAAVRAAKRAAALALNGADPLVE